MIAQITNHKLRTTNPGFTLLEVLIATIILTGGVVAIIWAFSSGLFATTDAENVDLALNIAQANMEQIKNKTFTQIVADGDSGPTADTNFPDFDVSVDIAEAQDPMQVDVTVAWDVKDGQANITLTTLVANY